QHPFHVDRYVEVVEDLQLHAAARHRQERQGSHQGVIPDLLGGLLAVVGRMVVLDGARELTDLLPVDLEIVRVPVVGSDDAVGDAHAGRSPLDLLAARAYQRPFSSRAWSRRGPRRSVAIGRGADPAAQSQLVAARTPPLSRPGVAKRSPPMLLRPRRA